MERMDTYAMRRIGSLNGVSLAIEGDELLIDARRDSSGVILIFNHYDRILTGAIALAKRGFKINSLRLELNEDTSIPSDIRLFLSAKINKFDSIVGGISLGRRESMRRLYKGLEGGEMWCILADAWDSAATERKPYRFLGTDIYLSSGLERIALRTGAKLIHVASYTESASFIRVRLTRLYDPKNAIQDAITILSADVSKNPWAWWNWGIIDSLRIPPMQLSN
ncbi:hypothetical protein [Ottowia testudinis]|uniref:Uncharacterized protein n=1 Tax=Ottowia testudinis TaxID=2816950 RepID=A0A975CHJ7_9BURK|nr:hypothetical protein [Ottowia testudinis]QTD46553.1 hypothetical protein J1M35_06665 [Ottowia testudinis]